MSNLIKEMKEQQLIDEGYTEGKKSFEYQFDKILEQFDFYQVHKTMIALGWNWSFGNNKRGIPDINTLRNEAKSMLLRVYEEETSQLSSGGFSCGYEEGELWLTFNVEEAHTGSY